MTRPNIVVIMSDQHRGDWLGSAGNPLVRTPNLDRLATEGVSFSQAYCASPLCVPSRMAFMTGREPHHTGIYGNDDHLASDVPTFAHAAGLQGYDTVLCGRMHFVGPDQRHGFQQRLVGDITPSYPGGPKTDYGPLSRTPDPDRISIELAGPGISPVIDFDTAVVSACVAYLEERAKGGAEAPLLLTVGLYGPHAPFTCPPENFEEALGAVEAYDRVIPADLHPHPAIRAQRDAQRLDEVTIEQRTTVRANYVGLINHLDRNVGRILDAVATLPGDTMVIYTSDHGEMAGDHGLYWKRSFYEPSVRVPLLWCATGAGAPPISRGQVVETPVSMLDVATTLSAVCGEPLPNVDGQDIRSALAGSVDEHLAQRPIFSQLVTGSRSAVRMVRFGPYKLVVHHGARPQLFNLAEDPTESFDLAEDPGHTIVVEQLERLALNGWHPAKILDDRSRREADKVYLKEWGARVGYGPGDLWDQTGPFFWGRDGR